MKSIKITSQKIKSEIKIPTSKSYANRALIKAAIQPNEQYVADIPDSQDVKDMVKVLEHLGVAKYSKGRVHIFGSFPESEVIQKDAIEIDLGEGGTTIRFLMVLLSLGKNKYKLKVHPRFKLRPYKAMIKQLELFGVKITQTEEEDILCCLQGPIEFPETIIIDCSETTQYATAFLLLKHKYNLDIKLENLEASKDYIEMTNSIDSFFVENLFVTPGDFSSAGYYIALGLFFQKLNLVNIKSIDLYQADSKIIDILDQIGAHYTFDDGLEIVPKSYNQGFQIDGSSCLDLIPTLCVIASFIHAESKITKIHGLIYKETNRILGIEKMLNDFGVDYKIENDQITITGKSSYRVPALVETLPDHRLIMANAIFLKILGGGSLYPYAEVKKSFPDFFEILN